MTRAVVALFVASLAAAQGTQPARPRGEIRGQVVSADTKAPIANARIELIGSGGADSSRRAVSGLDGKWRVQSLRAGAYRVRIGAIGFAAKEIPSATISATAPTVDAGTVELAATAVELGTVAIRDRQEAIALAPDRNAYVVHDMPTVKGGTALDVLRNVPSVDVDIDNIVSLRGNSGVIIQVNGRPSPLKGGQLGNFLAQLPADVVTTIEVISNPSAREDATGVAGIINIILKQETDAGTSGGLTAGYATTGTENLGANYGYDRGHLSLFGSYGIINDRRSRVEAISRDNLYTSPRSYLDEYGIRFQKPLMHTFTGSVTYDFTKQDELAGDILFSTRTEPEFFDVLYTNLDAPRRTTTRYNRFTDGLNHEGSLEGSLDFKHTFADKGHKFTAGLRLDQSPEGGPTSIAQHEILPSGAPGALQSFEKSTPWAHPTQADFTMSYARPITKTVRFETGYKGSLQQFHSTLDTRLLDTASGAFVQDTARTADVRFDQRVHALYGILSAQFGDFTFQGGVRAERASTVFRPGKAASEYDNSYDEAYPSGLIVYHVDDNRELKLSYSTRIRRPDDADVLDPTPHILDPLNIRRGNPYLKPEIIRAFELGFQQTAGKMTLQVTPYYRHTFDAIRTIRTIDSAGVATQTYANISTADASGLDVTVALGGGRISGFVGGSAYKQVSNASNVASGISVNTFGWTTRSNVTWRASNTVDVQALVNYTAPMDVEQGHNAARARVSVAARRKFMDDQLGVTLRVIDPFSMSLERSMTYDPRFNQVSDRIRSIRALGLNVNWTFGEPEKEKKTDLIGEPPAP